ncbi:MAG: GxxExxY protein, partial [Chloroflexota bacterium]
SKENIMAELLFKEEVYAIIGAAMEVYNQLGPGFGEAIYQEALEIESDARKIPNNAQQEIYIRYKETRFKQFFKPDFIYYGKIVAEIKAMDRLTSREEAQLLNYLKATGMPLGILINFGAENNLEWKRMASTQGRTRKALVSSKLQVFNPQAISED